MIFKVFGIFWHFAVLKLHAASRRGLGAIATFSDLSTLKTWFGTKSPSETIDHIVPEAMEQLGIERDELELKSAIADNGAMIFDNAPSMTFTKPLSVLVDGKPIPNPKWASLLHTILGHVKAKEFEGAKLVQELTIPARAEKYEEGGYKYQPHLCISVQGQSAADAWKEVDRFAKKWRIPVVVEFMWRYNPKAQYPGKTGILCAGGI